MNFKKLLFLLFAVFSLISCNNDDIWSEASDTVTLGNGLFVLNEGAMGNNNASLDFLNLDTGEYTLSVYTKVNPDIVNKLGDIGNDLRIYNGKLYAVINGSNYIEVMDAQTAKHLGQIKINNCRSIVFNNGYAYVTSFNGPIVSGQKRTGIVYKINTADLSIVNEVAVGYQPEEMAIANNKLYVANSGGYTQDDLDNTVSIIDLNTFTETQRKVVAPNLWRVRTDKNNKVWISSRGNAPGLSVLSPENDEIIKTFNITVSDMAFYQDKLYYYGTEWVGSTSTNQYGVIDITTQIKIADRFLDESTQSEIKTPYGITINPKNGDIFIADATNYYSPGKLYRFNSSGTLLSENQTGVIPGHFAFLTK
ncbi:YncE family protein [Apibacter raozihei]|uniref:YncE family protein n=1 Tax=Apibacter TaxID=1778601 RepID=UPI000FE3AF8A|nr:MULTISPECIES: DUF5074 domain-containing protein [Apibacter]